MTVSTEPVIVIGRTGQLALELQKARWPADVQVEFLGRDRVDLARPAEIRKLEAKRPRLIINAAAFTAVDAAESAREEAFAVNRDGAAELAAVCSKIGAALIHLSTDYVFDGNQSAAYWEEDPVNPLSVYGQSKAAGESAVRDRLDRHVILRTAWVYSSVGRNFVRTMLRLGSERDRLTIVDDQHGCPTYAADLAGAVIDIAAALVLGRSDGFGTFHFCGKGRTTWYGFAVDIFKAARERGMKTPSVVIPIATEAYPTPARRPRNSVLDCAKIQRTYGIAPRVWQEALGECLDQIRAAAPA